MVILDFYCSSAAVAFCPRYVVCSYACFNFLAVYRQIVGVLRAACPFPGLVGDSWSIFKRRISLHIYGDSRITYRLRNDQCLIAGKGGFFYSIE